MWITRLDGPVCSGGDSPAWDAVVQRLRCIDNAGRKVLTLDPATGQIRTLDMPSVITTLVLRPGGAVVALRTGIFSLDLDARARDEAQPLAEPLPHVFNDGKVDQRGRFVTGASTSNLSDPEPDSGLFRLDADRRLSQLDNDMTFSTAAAGRRMAALSTSQIGGGARCSPTITI